MRVPKASQGLPSILSSGLVAWHAQGTSHKGLPWPAVATKPPLLSLGPRLSPCPSGAMAEPLSQRGHIKGKAASWMGVSSSESRMRCGEARTRGTSTAVTQTQLLSGLRRPLSPVTLPGLGNAAPGGKPSGFQGLFQLPEPLRPGLCRAWDMQNEGHAGPQAQMGLSKAAGSHGPFLAEAPHVTPAGGRKSHIRRQASRCEASASLWNLVPPFLAELKHSVACNVLGLGRLQVSLMPGLAGAPHHPVGLGDPWGHPHSRAGWVLGCFIGQMLKDSPPALF